MEMLAACNSIIKDFEDAIQKPLKLNSRKVLTGVDLGTAYIVLSVLDEYKRPVAGAYRFASVVRDGLVVDYTGAIQIVKELKKDIEGKLGIELTHSATAVPPGTSGADTGTIRYVVEGAGFEVTNILDEPTAANSVLEIKNGAVVDIGGGTTGISIFEDGKVVYVADEPTGGTHFTLVLAGANRISFEEAEELKKNPAMQKENFAALKPVAQKVASIIKRHITGRNVESIYLVGGTSCLKDIEKVIEAETGVKTYKPENPLFVTPVGIAMNCL